MLEHVPHVRHRFRHKDRQRRQSLDLLFRAIKGLRLEKIFEAHLFQREHRPAVRHARPFQGILAMDHADNGRFGLEGRPMDRQKITQNKFFANVLLQMNVMQHVGETNQESLAEDGQASHVVGRLLGKKAGLGDPLQRIDNKIVERVPIQRILDVRFDVLEVLLHEADDKVLGGDPEDGEIRQEVAPDDRRLLDVGDVVVLLLGFLQIRNLDVFVLESCNVDAREGPDAMHESAKS